jgi:hypothetical protein
MGRRRLSRFRLACELDKLYILGNPGDKVKISLAFVYNACTTRAPDHTISTPETTTP